MNSLAELVERVFPAVEQSYTWRDTVLYALGCGYGGEPADLAFVYEHGLQAAPTMASVLAGAGLWYGEVPLDVARMVHAAEQIDVYRPLPSSGVVLGRTRVTDVIDRGAGRGALVICERSIHEHATGAHLATVTETAFCRGDGGRGGTSRLSPLPQPLPARPPDQVCSLPTTLQTALIYRLSGDLNPLHVDPATAAAAGFARPILHGRATFGVIGHALLRGLCGNDPARLRSIGCRFTRPVFPGETIRTELWQNGASVSFRAWAGQGVGAGDRAGVGARVVADQGRATVASG